MDGPDGNKALVRRFYAEIAAGNLAAMEELVSAARTAGFCSGMRRPAMPEKRLPVRSCHSRRVSGRWLHPDRRAYYAWPNRGARLLFRSACPHDLRS